MSRNSFGNQIDLLELVSKINYKPEYLWIRPMHSRKFHRCPAPCLRRSLQGKSAESSCPPPTSCIVRDVTQIVPNISARFIYTTNNMLLFVILHSFYLLMTSTS